MSTIVDQLSQGRTLVETHISWVFLEAEVVYKLKKPVDFGFLDFTTLEKRRLACEAEVHLNRRLSESVYFGVVPVCQAPDGTVNLGGSGEIVEWAVKMKRLPDTARADILLSRGELTRDQVYDVAGKLATFHAHARTDPQVAEYGTALSVGVNVAENFDQTGDCIGDFLSPGEQASLRERQLGFLEREPQRFEARRAQNRIVEGHGDLRLEHTYLLDAVNVIDCCEFNERFRCADVACDLAFLTMDLEHNGRPDLAELLLARYAREAGDYDLYGVVDFYTAYRAMVRAKVACFRLKQQELGWEDPSAENAAARRYFLHAVAAQGMPTGRPQLIAVGGLIASGKSTCANRISETLACPVVDTDRTRKGLIGVGSDVPVLERAFSGKYSAEFTQDVYSEVLRRAAIVLGSGRSVVVDASFSKVAQRAQVRELAQEMGVPFTFVECVTSRDEALGRLALRALAPSTSDGRAEIYDAFVAGYEPVNELPANEICRWDSADAEGLVRTRFGA